ncbi:MAG: thioredoxin domain-containing protein [Roseiarcus sp.]
MRTTFGMFGDGIPRSMTCTHCAAFHKDVWPKAKAKYVDRGRVNWRIQGEEGLRAFDQILKPVMR